MMVRPSIVVSWPRSCDYPVFRWYMNKYGHYFNQIIIAFTGLKTEHSYEEFLRGTGLKDVEPIFIDAPMDASDWRHVAVVEALKANKSDWVWFTEQDFLYQESFLQTIFNRENEDEVVGFVEERLHPACLLVSRSMLDKTSKDFSIQPNVADHFSKISIELFAKAKVIPLQNLGLIEGVHWYHLAGLTHNYTLCRIDRAETVYKPEEFLTYNYFARYAPVVQTPRFINESSVAEQKVMVCRKLSHLVK